MNTIREDLSSSRTFERLEEVVDSVACCSIRYGGRKFSRELKNHSGKGRDEYISLNDLLRQWEKNKAYLIAAVKEKQDNIFQKTGKHKIIKQQAAWIKEDETSYRILAKIRRLDEMGKTTYKKANFLEKISIRIKSLAGRIFFRRRNLLLVNLSQRNELLEQKIGKFKESYEKKGKEKNGPGRENRLNFDDFYAELPKKRDEIERHAFLTDFYGKCLVPKKQKANPLTNLLATLLVKNGEKEKEKITDTSPLSKLEKEDYPIEELIGMENVRQEFALAFAGNTLSEDLKKKLDIRNTPSGCLFYGPPGCGKSFLAAHLALETGRPTFMIRASQLNSKWVGEAPKLLAAMFAEAKTHAPCNLIIDEFDSLAPKRGDLDSSSPTSQHYREFVNELLRLLENARKDGIFVIGTTNYLSQIDEAVIREGRIDTKIEIPLPGKEMREKIFKEHLVPIDSDYKDSFDYQELVEKTEGWNISAIASLVDKIKIETGLLAKSAPVKISQKQILEKIENTKPSKQPAP